MSDDLTENVANQVNRIVRGQTGQYLEVSRDSGTIIAHTTLIGRFF